MNVLRRGAVGMSLVILVLATACGGDDPAAAPTPGATDPSTTPATTPATTTPTPGRTGRTVDVIDNAFVPPELTVTVGTEVIWFYVGPDARHTVTAADGSFDSHPDCPANLDACFKATGETFTFTFTRAGRFPYSCKVHGQLMSGTVVIE
jgi:plastocyanin